jgi:predicted pyridoxine 5'-phosphate oxidase superfamily flavin-nucleotide-binding protein
MGTKDIIKVIEANPVFIATSSKEGKVKIILVEGIKVKDGQLMIADTSNSFKKIKENVIENESFSLIVLNSEKKGYKIEGFADYLIEGDELEFVKSLEQNIDKEINGVFVFTPMATEEI